VISLNFSSFALPSFRVQQSNCPFLFTEGYRSLRSQNENMTPFSSFVEEIWDVFLISLPGLKVRNPLVG
jgi:hypothetical protein